MYENYGDVTLMEELTEVMTELNPLSFSNLGSSLVSIASYVLMALGMYTIAKRRGIRNPWLAWIPFGSSWMLGCISDQYRYVVKREVRAKRKFMLGLDIATTAVAVATIVMLFAGLFKLLGIVESNPGLLESDVIPDPAVLSDILGPLMGALGLCLVMLGLAIALAVLRFIALHDLFKSCNPENAVVFTVLSILLGGLLQSIFVFSCRNKEDGMPPPHQQMYSELPEWQPPQSSVDPWEMNNEH